MLCINDYYLGGQIMSDGIYINDSIHGLILLSEYERRIISSIGFNRLHDVYQNSTVYLTFPTNRTKRFEHSIGTMKLCSDIFYHSVLNSTNDTLDHVYKIFENEIENIINEIAEDTNICEQKLGGISPKKIPIIQFDKLRNVITPCNVKKKYKVIHAILTESIRVAGLLHDIGHPPFSHIVEYALKSVYLDNKNLDNNNSSIENFINTMNPYFEDQKKLHEQMGDEISESILKEVIISISDEDNDKYDENLFEIIVLKCVNKIFTEKGFFSDLHRIIDSSLDSDRLDYVTRDSVNSGLNSGKIDYNRIINDMKIKTTDSHIYFCVPLKAINSVEDFIKRRYNIYKDIIYHHRVIKTDYLLENSVKMLIEKYLKSDSNQKVSESHMVIPFDISGLWFPLGNATVQEKVNALSQWNDSWLMTVLRQIYYNDFYRNKNINNNHSEYILSKQLSELLRNKKCYYSLIKRSENFKIVDNAIKEKIINSSFEIENLIASINLSSKSIIQSESDTLIEIEPTFECINNIIRNTTQKAKGFVTSYIIKHMDAMGVCDNLKELIKNTIRMVASQVFGSHIIGDVAVVFKDISIGLDSPIYFYNSLNEICTLEEVSGISDILRLDSDYLPTFYIYILVKDSYNIIKEKKNEFLINIGKSIGKDIIDYLKSILNNKIKSMEENQCAR